MFMNISDTETEPSSLDKSTIKTVIVERDVERINHEHLEIIFSTVEKKIVTRKNNLKLLCFPLFASSSPIFSTSVSFFDWTNVFHPSFNDLMSQTESSKQNFESTTWSESSSRVELDISTTTIKPEPRTIVVESADPTVAVESDTEKRTSRSGWTNGENWHCRERCVEN